MGSTGTAKAAAQHHAGLSALRQERTLVRLRNRTSTKICVSGTHQPSTGALAVKNSRNLDEIKLSGACISVRFD